MPDTAAALLLLQRDATVTVCHSKTKDLAAVAAGADILVAAIGRPAFVTPKFVKQRRSKGKQITSLIEEFNYPKYGPGMMWERRLVTTVCMGSASQRPPVSRMVPRTLCTFGSRRARLT